MILHLFVGDLYAEKVPADVKFVKLTVTVDHCREHGIASDLYLSENIIRFNQTMHFPVGEDQNIINELEVMLLAVMKDGSERLMGSCRFVCTSGEHSVTKSVNINDHCGVLVGKVPITSFYYSSAIKLGDRVMFKPMYEPNVKEYQFLLSRRLRHASKAKPVTFDRNIEHQLNNDARDLIARDFTIVSAKALNKKKAPPAPPKPPKIASSAADSLTYNPGMTRNGAMSDAARGRVSKKPPVPRAPHRSGIKAATTTIKPRPPPTSAPAAVPIKTTTHHAHPRPKPTATLSGPPKLRETYMDVGYVREKKWPDREAAEPERNLYRLQLASEQKLQILRNIAALAKQRNARTAARQEAIRRKKQRVALQEGKIKRVLARREAEIQLLKGTLTHLRLTSALRDGKVAKTAKPTTQGFSRLEHLLYPQEYESTHRALTARSTRSLPTTSSLGRLLSPALRRRPASAPRSGSLRSGPSKRRHSDNLSVSFADRHASSPPAALYHPMAQARSPYDSRRPRPSTIATATGKSGKRPTEEELVDQLSEAFDMTFEQPTATDERGGDGAGARGAAVIAKDWLANARASINTFHRPETRSRDPPLPGGDRPTSAPGGRFSPKERPQKRELQHQQAQGKLVHTIPSPQRPSPRALAAAAQRANAATTGAAAATARGTTAAMPKKQAQPAHHSHHGQGVDDFSDSTDEVLQQRRDAHAMRQYAAPSFLNAFLEPNSPSQGAGGMDNTVSSIAVGDIPYFPTAAGVQTPPEEDGPQSSARSEGSSDSLENLSLPIEAHKHDRSASQYTRPQAENITNLAYRPPTNDRQEPYSAQRAARAQKEAIQTHAKHNFSIHQTRPGQVSARPAPSSHRRSAAEQLQRNRAYTTTAAPAAQKGTGTATPAQSGTANAGSSAPHVRRVPVPLPEDSESEHVEQQYSDAVEGEAGEGYSLSASMIQSVAEVNETVSKLQNRVTKLQTQQEQERVPAGWKLRSHHHDGGDGAGNEVGAHGPPTGPVLMAPFVYDDAPAAAADAKIEANRPAVLGAKGGVFPAEEDLKIVFDEASSSSGEFDLLRHKEAVARKK